jgi:hypothetical protein
MERLLPIVEGDGDMQAVPLLMRRVLNEVLARTDVTVLSAQKRGEWPKVKRDFERVYRSARLEAAPILWVVDFDSEDCKDPAVERKWLGEQAHRIDSTGRVEVADQARITARLDLRVLRSASESYRRFENAVQSLIQQE